MSTKKPVVSGLKYDSEKSRLDLISPIATGFLARVLGFGAEKYSANNWRLGIPMSKLIAASQRHLEAIKAGIDFDHETGLPHAAHLMCEAMFMCEQLVSLRHNMYDDRYKINPILLAALLEGDMKKVSECIKEIKSNQSK